MSKIVLWLPTLLTVLFLAKSIFIHHLATHLHERLGEIEDLLGARDSGYYSRSYEISGEDTRWRPLHFAFKNWLWFYWSLVLLVNIVALALAMVYFATIWSGINCE